jgi:hypothetical protein
MKAMIQILVSAALLSLTPAAPALAETFDLVTFTPPAGQRETQTDHIGFTETAGNAFCQLAVYHSLPGSGDPGRDFEAEWDGLVAKRYRVTGTLSTKVVDWPGGWKLTLGAAPVSAEGAGDFVSMLAVFSGHGVRIPVLVNYNDERYQEKFNNFLTGLQLRPPAPSVATPAAVPSPAPASGPGGPPALTSQEWYRAIASYSHWGFNFTGPELAKMGNQGYSKWTYRFQPDGSYSFVSEFWSMNRNQEYWFVEEDGAYRVTGDIIHVSPRQVRRILRNKAGQQQGEAVPLDREETSYRYKFHYLSGMEKWYLILSPADGKETRRDGSFSGHQLFPAAYLYSKPPLYH